MLGVREWGNKKPGRTPPLAPLFTAMHIQLEVTVDTQERGYGSPAPSPPSTAIAIQLEAAMGTREGSSENPGPASLLTATQSQLWVTVGAREREGGMPASTLTSLSSRSARRPGTAQ